MRQRIIKPRADPHQDFDWREIPCDTEAAAQAEAERQQALEAPEEVEWIYLRNKSKQWVARRTPRHLFIAKPSEFASEVTGGLLESVLDYFLK